MDISFTSDQESRPFFLYLCFKLTYISAHFRWEIMQIFTKEQLRKAVHSFKHDLLFFYIWMDWNLRNWKKAGCWVRCVPTTGGSLFPLWTGIFKGTGPLIQNQFLTSGQRRVKTSRCLLWQRIKSKSEEMHTFTHAYIFWFKAASVFSNVAQSLCAEMWVLLKHTHH